LRRYPRPAADSFLERRAVILASPKTLGHSPKARSAATTSAARSESRLTKRAGDWLAGRDKW